MVISDLGSGVLARAQSVRGGRVLPALIEVKATHLAPLLHHLSATDVLLHLDEHRHHLRVAQVLDVSSCLHHLAATELVAQTQELLALLSQYRRPLLLGLVELLVVSAEVAVTQCASRGQDQFT